MRKVNLVQTTKRNLGNLFLHSMPARNESWNNFLEYAKNSEIDKVICLISSEEIQIKSPDYWTAIKYKQLPFGFIQFSVEDFGTPKDEAAFFGLVKDVATHLKNNEAILIHCAAGIGRTGMFASCLLQALGFSEKKSFSAG